MIGAALLAAGIVLNRIFETFWPSREAERQRAAEMQREERQARRGHRADLVKPLIDIIDGVSVRTQKTQVNELIRKLASETTQGMKKMEELGVA